MKPPNTGDVMELDEILKQHLGFPQDYIFTGETMTVFDSAKSKLTKYIEQEIKKARIDELTKFTQDMNAIRVDDGFVPTEYTYIRKRIKELGESNE
jgi:hypothetical protein